MTEFEIITALTEILGAEHVRADLESRQRAVSSWSPTLTKLRQEGKSPILLPLAVALPGDTEQVLQIVRWANDTVTRLVPVGGASNTVGSGYPVNQQSIALDLSRLQTVRWDEESLLVHAGAGCVLSDLEAQMNQHGYTLGSLPQSARLATVGGAIATNAIGLLSGRYGRQSDTTAGLEAVLPQGHLVRAGGDAPGASAYFDVLRLFVGTEGVFGVITEVTLRLSPLPEVRAWTGFLFRTLSDAVDALRLVYRSDSRPAVARLFDYAAARSLSEKFSLPLSVDGGLLLLGFEGDELAQTGPYQIAYAVCQKVGGAPQSADVGETWFEEQKDNTNGWAANARPGGLADVLTVSAPWSRLKAVYDDMHGAISPFVTHLSGQVTHPTPHGAAIEFAFAAEAQPPEPEAALELYSRITDAGENACHKAGGSFPHHYGVGKSGYEGFTGESSREGQFVVQRLLKKALDPKGIFPSRF